LRERGKSDTRRRGKGERAAVGGGPGLSARALCARYHGASPAAAPGSPARRVFCTLPPLRAALPAEMRRGGSRREPALSPGPPPTAAPLGHSNIQLTNPRQEPMLRCPYTSAHQADCATVRGLRACKAPKSLMLWCSGRYFAEGRR